MWITQREDYYNNKGYTDTQHATEHAQNINIFITTHPPPLQKKIINTFTITVSPVIRINEINKGGIFQVGTVLFEDNDGQNYCHS